MCSSLGVMYLDTQIDVDQVVERATTSDTPQHAPVTRVRVFVRQDLVSSYMGGEDGSRIVVAVLDGEPSSRAAAQ